MAATEEKITFEENRKLRQAHGPFLLHRTPVEEGQDEPVAAEEPPLNACVSAVRVAQTATFVDAIQVQYRDSEADWHGSFEASGEFESAWDTLCCYADEHITRVVLYLTPAGQVRRLKLGTSAGRVLDSTAANGIDVDAGGTTTRMCECYGAPLRGVAETVTTRDGVTTREVSFLFGDAAPPSPPSPASAGANALFKDIRSFSAPEARLAPIDVSRPEIVNEPETWETYFQSESNTRAALVGLDLLRAKLCYPRSSPRGGRTGEETK